MKYEKPKLIKLSDFSHHIAYGLCSGGSTPKDNPGQGQCSNGGSANGQCNSGSGK